MQCSFTTHTSNTYSNHVEFDEANLSQFPCSPTPPSRANLSRAPDPMTPSHSYFRTPRVARIGRLHQEGKAQDSRDSENRAREFLLLHDIATGAFRSAVSAQKAVVLQASGGGRVSRKLWCRKTPLLRGVQKHSPLDPEAPNLVAEHAHRWYASRPFPKSTSKGGFSVEFAEPNKPRAASASVPCRFRGVSGGFGGFRAVFMGRF